MLASTTTEAINPGVIFWGSVGIITVTIFGVMGCIPTKKTTTENKPSDGSDQERGESTPPNGGKWAACGNWVKNIYNVTCYTHPGWPCWKTALIKAIVMFVTTLGSALASLAITRVFAEEDEKLETTVARVIEFVLGDNGSRRRRDTKVTATLNTNELTTILTAAVICAAWIVAMVTVLVTYVSKKNEEDENGEVGGGEEVMADTEMAVNPNFTDELQTIICNEDRVMRNREMPVNQDSTDGLRTTIYNEYEENWWNFEGWLSAWTTMIMDPILGAVSSLRKVVMG